jgi:hypothetical protein
MAKGTDDFPSRALAGRDGSVHGAGAPLQVGCLAGKEKSSEKWTREQLRRFRAADSLIAVCPARERIVGPVVRPHPLDQPTSSRRGEPEGAREGRSRRGFDRGAAVFQ